MTTIKIKRSALRTCIKNAQITKKQEGMFVPYEFIALKIKNNKPIFYSSVQASSNSWTNYEGCILFHNGNFVTKLTKRQIEDYIWDNVSDNTTERIIDPNNEFIFEYVD